MSRAQMIIVAGAVVAVALIAVLGAFLQLGYHPGDESTDQLDPPSETRRVVSNVLDTGEATVREASWETRHAAVESLQETLRDSFRSLERTPTTSIRRVRLASAAAADLIGDLCPRGPARRFGPCAAIDGVIVQNRDDTTHLVAVVLEVTVVTQETETVLTVVVRPTPRVESR